MDDIKILITCEHGGNQVPDEYFPYFVIARKVLNSHRGWDIGALLLAKEFEKLLNAPLFYSEISRLVVDLNRSIGNGDLFSSYMSPIAGNEVVEKFYKPYRDKVESYVDKILKFNKVVHLGVHSFTPVLEGIERTTDIGILVDEDSIEELNFAKKWQNELKLKFPNLQIDINKPYNGKDDGFTTHLRRKYNFKNYLGIELEVNQKYEHAFVGWADDLSDTLLIALGHLNVKLT